MNKMVQLNVGRYSLIPIMVIFILLGISQPVVAMEHTTLYDYNLDFGPNSKYDLPSSKSQWDDGMDVWVNVSIVNYQTYAVVLRWKITWYRPDGTVKFTWQEGSGSSISANCHSSACFNHYEFCLDDYEVIPGSWRVLLEVTENPTVGGSTGWQAVVDTTFLVAVNTRTISGYVKTGSGSPISSVVMNGLPNTPSTDINGFYSDTVNNAWSGTVTPNKTGYSFTPPSKPYSSVTSNKYNQDYTGTILPPTIATNTDALSPSCQVGENAPGQTFEVWNSGSNTLNYTITDNANSGGIDWLSCSPTSDQSTGEHKTVDVTYNTSGLSSGSYSATITVSVPEATNPQVTIPVNLTVSPLPQATISGYIKFCDRSGNLLTNLPQTDERIKAVPSRVTITVWPAVSIPGDSDVYEWPFSQTPIQKFSFSDFTSPYVTGGLGPGKYLVGVSIYDGVDEKILRFEIKNPPQNLNNADFILTLEDVEAVNGGEQGPTCGAITPSPWRQILNPMKKWILSVP